MRRQNRNKRSGGGSRKGTADGKRLAATLDLKAEDLTPETKTLADASQDQPSETHAEAEQDQTDDAQTGDETQTGTSERLTEKHGWLAGAAGLITHIAAGLAGGIVVLGIATQFGWIAPAGDVGEMSSAEIAKRLSEFEKRLDAPGPEKRLSALLEGLRNRLQKAEQSVGAVQKQTTELAEGTENVENRLQNLLSASKAGGGNSLAAADALNKRIAGIETRLDGKILSLKRELGDSSKQTADDLSKRVAKKATEDEVEAVRRLLRDGTERFLRDVQTISSETRELRRSLTGLERQVAQLQTQSEKVSAVSRSLEPVNQRIAALDGLVKGLVSRESKMQAGSRRTALAISLTRLRRAVDAGSPFADELDVVRKFAPKGLLLKELEQVKDTGAQTAAALERSFPVVIKAVLDADTAQRQDSVIGQLLSNARSVIRIRRTGEVAGDSTEAVIARMETRVKSGNLTAALEESQMLKGGALKAAERWLGNVKARIAVDWAMRRVETELVAVLGGVELGGDESKGQ